MKIDTNLDKLNWPKILNLRNIYVDFETKCILGKSLYEYHLAVFLKTPYDFTVDSNNKLLLITIPFQLFINSKYKVSQNKGYKKQRRDVY